MKQSYLKYAIFISMILISNQESNDVIEFTVEKLEIPEVYCRDSRIEYEIKGSFNGSNLYLKSFSFDAISNGNKYESGCNPTNSYEKLYCHVKLRYPVNTSDIFLPTSPPETDNLILKNWENVFGSRSGEIIKLKNMTCMPEESKYSLQLRYQ